MALGNKVKNYSEALKMVISNYFNYEYFQILSEESPESEDFENKDFVENYDAAIDLYGLMHARYILSPQGMHVMQEKYLEGCFGSCPRLMCK